VKSDAFENVKDQIGCCGIWCGSCVVGAGVLGELTRRYVDLAKGYGLEHWGPQDVDYPELYRALEAIEGAAACVGCLKGGGRDDCELRACVSAKGISDCSVCDAQDECKHAALLEHMRSGALKVGLFVKTDDVPREELIEEWTAVISQRWPFRLPFEH
jgi:hypothetical protein